MAGPFTITTPHQSISAQRLIITAGGKSWPGCGTTGDGYAWLQQLGHSIVPPQPALVPLIGGTPWMHALSGLTIDDVQVSVWSVNHAKRPLAVRRSSLLFTHKGFSGPAVMDVSRAVTLHGPAAVKVLCDWTPNLSTNQMELWIDAQRKERGSSRIANALTHWLPKRFADAICTAYNLHQIPLAEMSKVARAQVLQILKAFELPIVDSAGFNKAEVTTGGVQLREIDPRTMASRIAPGLYIAGEILDLDGWIGGYNFQAAFSTGYVAGQAAARSLSTVTSVESKTPLE
jgi:predicted Rossmann fold flavoprotein